MLVLTRRVGEEIVIGGEIRVTVAAVNGQRVRLGVTAPHSVRVVRLELLADDSRSQKSRMAEGRPSRDAQGQSLIAQCGRNE